MKIPSTALRFVLVPCLLLSWAAVFCPAASAQTSPLSLAITATPDPVRPGETIQYTFTATNTGTTTLSGASVTYRVPNNTTIGYYGPGEQYNAGFGDIPPGQSRTQSTAVLVNAANASTGALAPPDGTVITLTAVAANNSFSTTGALDVKVAANPAFNLQIVADEDNFVTPGSTVSYLLRYGNTGLASNGAVLRMPLPAGTTFVAASDGGTLGADGVVQWNVGAPGPGQSGVRRLSVAVNASLPGGTILPAQAEIHESSNPANSARDTSATVVRTTTLLGLTVKAATDAIRPGQVIDYTFTATNHSLTALTSVTAYYRVPGHTAIGYYGPGETYSASFGNIPPGQSRTVETAVLVDAANASTGALAPPDGTIIHMDVAAAGNQNFHAFAAAEVTVNANPAFSLQIDSDDSTAAAPGAALNYTVRYGNTGAASGGAILRVPLPKGTTLASASDGGALGADGVVQWNVGALSAGQSGVRKLGVTVNASLTAGTVVAAQAEMRDAASGASLARGTTADTVRTLVLLTTTVTPAPDTTVLPGGTINYTFTATNHNSTALTNVTAYYRVPVNTTVGYYGPGEDYSAGFGNIPPGQSRTATASVKVNAADASTGATAPPNGTIIHLEVETASSETFAVTSASNVTVNANTHPSYFTGESALNNGVYYLAFPNGNFFGYYSYLTDPHYIYHFDLGYEYLFDAADGHNGVYFYDFKSQGFFYSSPVFPFPYLYDFSLNTVLYYYPDTSNPGHYNTNGYRFFYRFDNGQIIVK